MKTNTATITFYGGARSVTGSNFMFEVRETNMLVDCGFFQGSIIGADRNRKDFGYNPRDIDILFVTHAHIDHIGRIPMLVKQGFNGKIYSTPPTHDIAKLMLTDSMRVLAGEAREKKIEPIYNEADVVKAMSLWETYDYHDAIKLPEGGSATLKDAGHILGSAMIDFEYNGKHVVFTGDLGNSPAPLLYDTESIAGADYLIMESVYGDRNHENLKDRQYILEDVIEETINSGGVLMVPAFSLERTQDLLFEINNLVENGKIPSVPVYLDSPLAIKVTDIYKQYQQYFNKNTQDVIKSGDDIFSFPKLKRTLSREESMEIVRQKGPKIILAGSGMSNGGRIIHHEKQYLSDPKNTLLLVGYQAPGTRGREIADGAKEVEILGKKVVIKAKVINLRGYSAHKDSDALFDFVNNAQDTLKKVFVVLGEPKSSFYLAQRIRDYIGVEAVIPDEGDKVTLEL